MRIGGLQKYSLIDYPPLVSCVIFTSGCNFRCPYCHNPGLVAPGPGAEQISEQQVLAFLKKRKGFLDAAVISGGEPTLQPGLEKLCLEIKNLGLSLKIDTNGSHPRVLESIISRGLADYIAMDLKCSPENYPYWISEACDPGAIRESIRLILGSGLSHEFRTTCVKPLVDQHVIRELAHLIAGADLHALQHPHTENVLVPEFFSHQDRVFNDDDLEHFRSIMESYVSTAIIR